MGRGGYYATAMRGGNKLISKIRQNRYTAAAPGGKPELNQKLKNKTILITGAAGGLGSELSFLCAAADCNTVMLDIDRKGLESTYDFIIEKGLTEPVLYPIDLASATPEHFEELVNALDSEFGGLDGLIHCAARFEGLRPLEQISPPEWLRQMQVNINACWLLSVSCLPLLRKSSTASLYFLLEDLDRMSGPFWGAYGVSKHALKALTSQFAAECTSSGIQVLGINPGPMRTPIRASAYHGENPGLQPEPAAAATKILEFLSGERIPETVFVDLT
jgi:NAD(P)-dependent dehydrogenase (short-subunit alcohol dehydrogenase family)